MNKSLAKSNKSHSGIKATNKSEFEPRLDPTGADHRIAPAIKQTPFTIGGRCAATSGGRIMTNLWRLHVRPDAGEGDVVFSTNFCLQNSLIGMGWLITRPEITRSSDFDWYRRAASEEYGNRWSSVRNFVESVREGDLVWFRDPDGCYYVAEVTGPWEYRYEGDHIRADIVNIRPARIHKVGLADRVPGKIIACFRPPRTLQRIDSPEMLIFTQHLMGLPSEVSESADVLDYLTAEDLENVVAIYLQTRGWLIIPGTRRCDTPHYEFVLVHGRTGERAIVQVKSGNTWLNATAYEGPTKTFLFAASGSYGNVIPNNVDAIKPSTLRDFMIEHQQLLPDAVVKWMEIARAVPTPTSRTAVRPSSSSAAALQ
jgi:hypothetical protein